MISLNECSRAGFERYLTSVVVHPEADLMAFGLTRYKANGFSDELSKVQIRGESDVPDGVPGER